ncbi:MAG TPA: hypothetical protein VJS44_11100 [Pyrinomonadaceae bacterium]|nr:hypothetical protein [Pyrinomonadaceae bacterium]
MVETNSVSGLRRARLTQLLVAKSVIEALFVGVVAVGFYYTAFSPHFRGWSDMADARVVSGWAVNEAAPGSPVEVQVYIDGRFAGDGLANQPRPDVVRAGRSTTELCGFQLTTPPLAAGEHEARVYAVHPSAEGTRRTLQQIGVPLRFRVEPEEAAGK